MFINTVTYEITDKCNARCPQCMRTNSVNCSPQSFIRNKDISITEFKKLAPKQFLETLSFIDFNCPMGDPAAHSSIFSILDYITSVNNNVEIWFPTNGSLRNISYWKRLASYPQVKVIFALDGIDQITHEFYRRNTNFKKIINNATAYIEAGGSATWQFIIFKHNQHQVDAAKDYAYNLGFKKFKPIISNRFNGKEKFEYTYNNTEYTLYSVEQTHTPPTVSSIECRYLKNQHVFIDIKGQIMACCFHAGSLFAHQSIPKSKSKFNNYIDVSFDNYDLEQFSILKVGFETAYASYEQYMKDLEEQWRALNPPLCKVVCGKC
jgi:MoaA/NifB/PqqE/SkfB family radical SAM enzyme